MGLRLRVLGKKKHLKRHESGVFWFLFCFYNARLLPLVLYFCMASVYECNSLHNESCHVVNRLSGSSTVYLGRSTDMHDPVFLLCWHYRPSSGVMLLWPDYTHASTQYDEYSLNIQLPLVKLREFCVVGTFL